MAKGATRTVALMAIQPRFADLILRGTKKVEFRKTRFRKPVSHVVIYASWPIKRVVGVFEVEGLDIADPLALWERYDNVAGISREDFMAYYKGHMTGVAIRVGHVTELSEPVPLTAVHDTCTPPQSFQYVETSVLSCLGV